LTSGFIVRYVGVATLITLSTGCCAAVAFAIIGLKTTTSVVLIAIIYGFFGGIYIALISPLLTILTDDISELGIRMGVGFAVTGLGALIGPPVVGALLGERLVWWRAAVFAGFTSTLGFLCFAGVLFILHRRQRRLDAVRDGT